MAKRIDLAEMYRHMNKASATDVALLQDKCVAPVLLANAEIIAGKLPSWHGHK
ncbi:MAG: hypothetical protein WBG95_11310 [Sulfitobacter sp.]